MKLIDQYLEKQKELRALMDVGSFKPESLFAFQELCYRICVLETMRDFCKTAPVTTDPRVLCTHFKIVDAYIHFLTTERQLGSKTDEEGQKARETAYGALDRVVKDYQRRFSSFQATSPDQYQKTISATINTVMPVWLQYRTTYIKL